jgi:hypothetical protein
MIDYIINLKHNIKSTLALQERLEIAISRQSNVEEDTI